MIIKEQLENINIQPSKSLRFIRKVKWLFGTYLKDQHDAKILTKNGYLYFNSKDKTTGRILHVYKNHEFEEMQDVVLLLEKIGLIDRSKENTVIDIGGYLGMSSTGFLLANLFQKAYSFEPSPENFRLLQKNIEINELQNSMFAYNIALSDSKGSLEFELSTKNHGDNRVKKTSATGTFNEENREVIAIEANTFDDFLQEHPEIDQDKIKLLWMDIQGHEGLFLKGAKQFIQTHPSVPTAMEFWPYGIERSGVRKEDFLGLVTSLYKKFYILGDYNTSYNIEKLEEFYDLHPLGGDGLNILLIN